MSKSLITPTAISRKINRTPASVLAAVRRLGIKPDLQVGRFSFYDISIIDTVVQGMRKPNRKAPSPDVTSNGEPVK